MACSPENFCNQDFSSDYLFLEPQHPLLHIVHQDDLLAEPEKPVATAIIAADPDDDDPLGGDDQLFGGAMGIF